MATAQQTIECQNKVVTILKERFPNLTTEETSKLAGRILLAVFSVLPPHGG